MKILLLLSNILGNAAFSKNILNAVSTIPDVELNTYYFEYSDYNVKTPKYLLKNYRSSYILRNKINKENINNDYDMLFFQSFHLTPCFKDWIAETPSIVSHDQTPASSFRLLKLENNTFQNRIACNLKNLLNHFVYRSVLKKVKVFMPWTTYCADSLMKDYKIVFSKIIIAPGYINIQAWDSGKIPRDFLKKRLLFVGNDFKRKGGDFLLEILKLLDKSYHLTIVTNDSSVNSANLPENVEVIKGVNSLTQLGPIYESSSLFVFPTKREQMGVVLMEAAATGLPSIVTDVGGVTEIIKHNKTGILMPYSSSAAEWAIAIENIFKQPEQLHKFSQYTNTLSKEKFSKSAYVKLLKDAFELALKS